MLVPQRLVFDVAIKATLYKVSNKMPSQAHIESIEIEISIFVGSFMLDHQLHTMKQLAIQICNEVSFISMRFTHMQPKAIK